MKVSELWRYPVKSMAGERLDAAEVTLDGITGDRQAMVVRDGRILTARSHPHLLGHKGGVAPDGSPTIDGLPWNAPEIAAAIGANVIRYDGPERFDILPLLIATDGAIAALGEDGRRLRPNIVIGGVDGLAEREWEGRRIRIGEAVIFIRDLRERCVMTTYDPDTQQQNLGVLRKIVRDFDGRIALNCSVETAGRIHSGDAVEFI